MRVKIKDIKPNPDNPRIIKDDKFKRLVQSIKDFPQMLELRPIVVNSDMMVLGGNMRLKACHEAGLTEVPVLKAEDLTEEQQREFIIKDNVGFGEWDWDELANNWDVDKLDAWGLEVPVKKELNEQDLFDIDIPFYTPSEVLPTLDQLASLDRMKELSSKIDQLDVSAELKAILHARASFFVDFYFDKIADFYSRQVPEVQEVFKELGMVVLAPKEALERGFVGLSEYLIEE